MVKNVEVVHFAEGDKENFNMKDWITLVAISVMIAFSFGVLFGISKPSAWIFSSTTQLVFDCLLIVCISGVTALVGMRKQWVWFQYSGRISDRLGLFFFKGLFKLYRLKAILSRIEKLGHLG